MSGKILAHHHRVQDGHGTEFLRNAFLKLIDEYWRSDEPLPETFKADSAHGPETIPVKWLLGQLHNCADVLPGDCYTKPELQGTQTYAVAARKVMATIHEEKCAALVKEQHAGGSGLVPMGANS